MGKSFVTNEQVEKARHASLASYFESHGYDCELRKGELHVKGFQGLNVNIEKNSWYQFGTRTGSKNPIDCLVNVLDMDFKDAVSALSGESINHHILKNYSSERKNDFEIESSKELKLPKIDKSTANLKAYLIKSRGINSEIINEMIDKKLIYQGITVDKFNKEHKNIVFVHYDKNGKKIGAEIQGANSFKRYKGVASGTSDSVFTFQIGTPNRAYIFESAIDLMSFKQLANPAKLQNCYLISMAGLKPNPILKLQKEGIKIYSCVDNDEAGIKFNTDNNFISCNKALIDNGVKDWNELLQKRLSINYSKEEKTLNQVMKETEKQAEKYNKNSMNSSNYVTQKKEYTTKR